MSFFKKVSPYVWLVLYAVVMLVAGGKWSIPFAPWIATIFGLLYILSVPHFWRGTLYFLIATYIPIVFSWYGVVPFPMPIYPIFMLINAIAGMLPYIIARLIMKRIDLKFAQPLVYPIVATGVEFFMMNDAALGTFGASAYTQYAFGWLTQTASITGLWGITFLVSWFAATVAWIIIANPSRSQLIPAVSIYGVVLIVALGFGFNRLSNQPDYEETALMAGITAQSIDMSELMPTYADDVEAFREETQAIHAAYIEKTQAAIESDAELVLWAELAGIGVEEDVTALVEELKQIADSEDVYLAIPVFIVFPDDEERVPENRLYIIDPDGETVIDHVKYGGNMIEGTLAGEKELQVVDTPFGQLSGVICWDTDYPEVVRQAGESGVDILLSPSYVWDGVASMHFDMAAFRAIENGMTVVRQSDHGLSGVITPYGKELVRVDTGTDTLLMDVPINASFDTPFPSTGLIVGQASLVGTLLLVIAAVVMGFMRRRANAGEAAA